MVDMTLQRWNRTNQYISEVFGREDPALAKLAADAREAGLPDIAIDAAVGRLLLMLTSMTNAKHVIEVGTLGGYSAAWIAKGLAPTGSLTTIEVDPRHADFAQIQFERLGIADRITVRVGDGIDVLRDLASSQEPGTVDLAFLDADKQQYPDYWQLVRPMLTVGGLIVIDNAFGAGDWWIDDDHPAKAAIDQTSRMIADDPDFEAVAFPLRQGVLVGRRMR